MQGAKNLSGIDEKLLQRTSLAFIREDAPILKGVRNYIIQDPKLECQSIQVQKETGQYRPFLVMYNPHLHCNLFFYCTTSMSEDRCDAENRIWGHHLVERPRALRNYIEYSAISGAKEGKLHLVDKSMFLPLTLDSLVDIQSRATKAEDLGIFGYYGHYKNLIEIGSFLELDMQGSQFEQSMTNPKPERWRYLWDKKAPVIYSPSAMYVSLYLNMALTFNNAQHTLTEDELIRRQQVTQEALTAYSKYCLAIDNQRALSKSDPRLLQAVYNAIYYNELINQRSYQLMEEAENTAFAGVAGDPIVYAKMPYDARLMLEFNRLGVKGKLDKNLKRANDLIHEYFTATAMLAKSAQSIIAELNSMSREDQNLSSVAYNEPIWHSFYTNYKNPNYLPGLSRTIDKVYAKLVRSQTAFVLAEEKRQEKQKQAALKEELLHQQEEAQKQERLAELTRYLTTDFVQLFLPSYKAYHTAGVLVTEEEYQRFREVTNDYQEPAIKRGKGQSRPALVLGDQLYEGLLSGIQGFGQLRDRTSTEIQMIEDNQQKIGLLSAGEFVDGTTELFDEIVKMDEKITIANRGASKKEKERLLIEHIKAFMTTEEGQSYHRVRLDHGTMEREFLSSIADIYAIRANLRGMVSTRNAKEKIIQALVKLNDPAVIESYQKAIELYDRLGGVTGEKPKSIAELSAELDAYTRAISTNSLTLKQYTMLEEAVGRVGKSMQRFIDQSAKLIELRNRLEVALTDYESSVAQTRVSTVAAMTILEEQANEKAAEYAQEDLQHAEKIENYYYSTLAGERPQHIPTEEELESAREEMRQYTERVLEQKQYTVVDSNHEYAAVLINRLFPSKEEILKDVDNRLGKCKTLQEAIKVYQSAIGRLNGYQPDLELLSRRIQEEYGKTLYSSQGLLRAFNIWQYLTARICSAYITLSNDQLDQMSERVKRKAQQINGKSAQECFNDAIIKASQTLIERAVDNYQGYFNGLYVRLKEIINATPNRVLLDDSIEKIIERSYSQKGNSALSPLPRSLAGSTGLSETLLALYRSKMKHVNILEEYLNYHRPQELTDSIELDNVVRTDISPILQAMQGVKEEQEKLVVGVLEDAIIGEAIAFGLESDDHIAFMQDPSGFTKLAKVIYKTKGRMGNGLLELSDEAKHAIKVIYENRAKILAAIEAGEIPDYDRTLAITSTTRVAIASLYNYYDLKDVAVQTALDALKKVTLKRKKQSEEEDEDSDSSSDGDQK